MLFSRIELVINLSNAFQKPFALRRSIIKNYAPLVDPYQIVLD